MAECEGKGAEKVTVFLSQASHQQCRNQEEWTNLTAVKFVDLATLYEIYVT